MTVTPATQERPRPRRATTGGGGFSTPEAFEPSGPVMFIPLNLHRRAERRIIITSPGTETPAPKPSLPGATPLALARGHRWKRMLDRGEFQRQDDLARHLGLNRGYVSRIICLTLLAPDIIEAFLDGREPSGLSLDALIRTPLPFDWPAQRKALGFPATIP